MSETNASSHLSERELEFIKLDVLRQRWRKAGLVFGVSSLLCGLFTLLALTEMFSYWYGTPMFTVLGFAVFASIPFLLMGFICMGVALSYRSKARAISQSFGK